MNGHLIAAFAVLLVALAVTLGWILLQWNECRDMGHSILYCVAHVT